MSSSSLGDILSMGMTIISYVMLFVFTLILLPSYIWQKNIKYVDIVQVFYVSLLFSMGISILAGWNDPESFHLDPYSLRNRYLAYFQHPNSVGLYAFFGVNLSLILCLLRRRFIYMLTLPFYLILIDMSGSRTALYCVIAMLLLFALKKFIYPPLLQMIKHPVVFLPLFMVPVALLAISVDKNALLETVDQALSNRITIWNGVLSKNEGWFDYLIGQGTLKTNEIMDNYYLVVITSTGLLGLAFFLAMVLNSLYSLLKQYSRSPQKALGMIIAVLLVLLLYSFTESVLFTIGNALSIFVWSSVGICFLELSHIRGFLGKSRVQGNYVVEKKHSH
ncbi:O-antigen ligase family protein [Paenibacillus validus]|uniref:O-antigen ligase family protein n=1 Tax=Paenibacillus validus TaxID=44253 RepID=UPI003D276F4A